LRTEGAADIATLAVQSDNTSSDCDPNCWRESGGRVVGCTHRKDMELSPSVRWVLSRRSKASA
jgi:hypothetical protein